jgi:hypothetical protein
MSNSYGVGTSGGSGASASAGAAMPGRSRPAQTAMGQRGDCLGIQRLDFEGWSAFVRSNCGERRPTSCDPDSFATSKSRMTLRRSDA